MEDRDRYHRGDLARGGILGLAVLVALAYAGLSLWRSKAAADLGRQVVATAQPGDIQMIASVTCSYCAIARQWMNANKVPFQECFIETDAQCAAVYQATMARGTPTLLVRGQMQLGFDAATVLARLQAPR